MLRWPFLLFLATAPIFGADVTPRDRDFFEKKVRPLLVERCYRCHSHAEKKQRGGLCLDSREAILTGGDTGPAVVVGNPSKSLLIQAVRYEHSRLKMPPKEKLKPSEVVVLEEWVRRGIPFPSGAAAKPTLDLVEARKFWAFRPVSPQPLPSVGKSTWPEGRIDAFLFEAMQKQGLAPAKRATKQTLVRRATFDLIGLPPTPTEIDAYEQDTSPTAYAMLVDRLLASPRYGERWGRFWLDLARYCDVAEAWAKIEGQPWRYRDWVVDAFNADLPYDRFVRLQLAADHVVDAPISDRAALGFLGLSPLYWKEPKLAPAVIQTIVAEEWEERIEAVSRTFLGLSVGCARCHDHKFDPITAADYYALAGVFASTRQVDKLLLPEDRAKSVQRTLGEIRKWEAELAKLKKQPKSAKTTQRIAELQAKAKSVRQAPLVADAPLARIVEDASLYVLPDGEHRTKIEYKPGVPRDVAIQRRGNPSRPGPLVRRRFLELFSDASASTFTEGSGRLELANAMLTQASGLTARVIVNRVWKHHFGKGLVETPSDFGSQGERPSHPALLDDLAARFVEHGQSLKWLHREIVLSAAYQQTSVVSEAVEAKSSRIDPDNRLLWRMNRRRLEIEAWRDAMLSVSGTLHVDRGGPPLDLKDANNRRRTIYGRVKRRELADLLRLHDFPDPTDHSPARVSTTTALQQLFVLNSPSLERQANALADRLKREVPSGNEVRIQRAYALLMGRSATPRQVQLGLAFLGSGSDDAWPEYCRVLLGSNEFLFVD